MNSESMARAGVLSWFVLLSGVHVSWDKKQSPQSVTSLNIFFSRWETLFLELQRVKETRVVPQHKLQFHFMQQSMIAALSMLGVIELDKREIPNVLQAGNG